MISVMHDITFAFESALEASTGWNYGIVAQTLQSIVVCNSTWEKDWDELAGENWGTILSPTETVALICSKVPLLFVKDAFFDPIAKHLSSSELLNLTIVSTIDFDLRQFTVKKDVIESIFNISITGSDFDVNCFSASDLWYFSV